MAEKKADKVKMGFGFYLFMLVLIVATAFLIILMVMMFSPGTEILGYQYFTDEQTAGLIQTTDASQTTIDFSSTSKIVVNVGYANVSVLKTDQVDQDSVIIENNVKGFARASANTEFSYSVKYDGTTLEITVTEAEGFAFFTKDVSVQICLPSTSNYSFANTVFVVTSEDGDVAFGTSESTGYALSYQQATITTTGGDITISTPSGNSIMYLNTINFKTDSGNVDVAVDALYVTNSTKISTTTGSISMERLQTTTLNLDIGNGSFSASYIDGSVTLICESANVDIGYISGSFDTNKASEALSKAQISVESVAGSVSIPYGNASTIYFGKISGESLIYTTSGSVTIGTQLGTCAIETETGAINVTLDDSSFSPTTGVTHTFISESGAINLTFEGLVKTENIVKTNGDVNVIIPSAASFVLYLEDYQGNPIDALSDSVTIEFVKESDYSYPFYINDYTGSDYSIKINAGGAIDISLGG